MTRRTIVVDSCIWKVYPTGRITVYGKDEFGLLFELGTAPSASAASLAIRLWDPRVPTHPSLSSLSGSSSTSSISRSPRGRRLRGDTECVERSAVDSLIQLRQRTNPRGLGCLSAASSVPCQRSDPLELA